MITSGMLEYWQSNEFRKIKNLKAKKACKKKIYQSDSSLNEEDDPIKPLINVQLQSAYYFFLIGVCVSILSIFIEISSFFITVIKPFYNGH